MDYFKTKVSIEEMMSNTIYFTLVAVAFGMSVYLYRYIDATKKKLAQKPSDTLKEDYKDL